MHTFHPKVCVILILIHIHTARRGRETTQAPAQPAPYASAAEHPALPEPHLCLPRSTPQEKAERGTSDTPDLGFAGTDRNRSQLPYSCLLAGKKTRGTATSEKAQKYFKYYFSLKHALYGAGAGKGISKGIPAQANARGCPSCGVTLCQGGKRVGTTQPRIL